MQITVDVKGKKLPLQNFWNNIHFHPTDAVEDTWGQRILDIIASKNMAQYVRLYTMFEDIVTRDYSGRLHFDFTEQDRRLDYMVGKGFKLLLCFNFMPQCMAAEPNILSGPRYKNKRFCRSEPSDYAEWSEVCAEQVRHLIERYGIEEVSRWYFHCWNEPDLGFWLDDGHYYDCEKKGNTRKLEEYCKLYDYFAEGVKSVSPRLRIGGPSCGHAKSFFEGVMKHVAMGKNNATGGTGAPIDFVSLHCYSSISQDLKDPMRYMIVPENIVLQYNHYRSIMAKYDLSEKEVVVDEWGAAAEGYLGIADDRRMVFRETEYSSAFYAKMINLFIVNKFRPPERIMLCLSGQAKSNIDFDGRRTLFTVSGYRKPICNAFILAAKRGGFLFEKNCVLPENVGIIPTIADNGRIAVMLYNFRAEISTRSDTVKIKLLIEGLFGKYIARHYRIDALSGNAFSEFLRLGSPEHPQPFNCFQIEHAGNNLLYYPEEKLEGISYSEDIVLPHNAVSLIELTPDFLTPDDLRKKRK